MKSHYHIDPGKYSLQRLKEDLLSRELIPSRKALKEGIEEKFEILQTRGITTLQDLINALKDKKKLEEFSALSTLSTEYLTLLRREANSYLPKPVPLNKFPGVSTWDLNSLADLGIKNSRHLFEEAGPKQGREELSKKVGLPLEHLNELVGMSDLVRAYGVGPVFARILYDTGIHSIRELLEYSPERIIHLYEEKYHQKADFSLHDIRFSLDVARVLDQGGKFSL
jgi:hypothetical protein